MPPTVPDILLRLTLAFVAGLIVGFERETRGRPAGLRTLLLVTNASAVAMILSELLLVDNLRAGFGEGLRADPARLGAGILTGMGFLGAATVLKQENIVRGVTTAATLWFMAVVGLAIGAGHLLLGGAATFFALAALTILGAVEHRLPSTRFGNISVTARSGSLSEHEFRTMLEKRGARILHLHLVQDAQAGEKVLACELRLKQRDLFEVSVQLVQELAAIPGVIRTEWR